MQSFKNIFTVWKREVNGYFNNALAYVLLFIFVILTMAFVFLVSRFLQQGDASLVEFFRWHPWIWMIVGPAIGMRLWSEEQRLGTMELILTMPVATWEVILGKFLAACTVLVAALLLTFSMIITVYALGDPDGGMIWSGYIGSFFVGASAVAITCAISAITRSQVACLLISVTLIFFLVLAGFPPFQDFVNKFGLDWLSRMMAEISLMFHLNLMSQGLGTAQSFIYYLSLIGFCLFLTSVIIRSKRA